MNPPLICMYIAELYCESSFNMYVHRQSCTVNPPLICMYIAELYCESSFNMYVHSRVVL